MSNVYFISDLHLGHKRVITFQDDYRAKVMGISTIEEHDQLLLANWHKTITKRDKVFVLGDIGYNIGPLKDLPGIKILIMGNHDNYPVYDYLEYFHDVCGTINYKGYWLSHFPVTENELYFRKCIHGHTHSKGINNSKYINVSVEMTRGKLINFNDIKSGKFQTWTKVNQPLDQHFMPIKYTGEDTK